MYKQLSVGTMLECYGIKGIVTFNDGNIIKIKWKNSDTIVYEASLSIDKNYKIVK